MRRALKTPMPAHIAATIVALSVILMVVVATIIARGDITTLEGYTTVLTVTYPYGGENATIIYDFQLNGTAKWVIDTANTTLTDLVISGTYYEAAFFDAYTFRVNLWLKEGDYFYSFSTFAWDPAVRKYVVLSAYKMWVNWSLVTALQQNYSYSCPGCYLYKVAHLNYTNGTYIIDSGATELGADAPSWFYGFEGLSIEAYFKDGAHYLRLRVAERSLNYLEYNFRARDVLSYWFLVLYGQEEGGITYYSGINATIWRTAIYYRITTNRPDLISISASQWAYGYETVVSGKLAGNIWKNGVNLFNITIPWAVNATDPFANYSNLADYEMPANVTRVDADAEYKAPPDWYNIPAWMGYIGWIFSKTISFIGVALGTIIANFVNIAVSPTIWSLFGFVYAAANIVVLTERGIAGVYDLNLMVFETLKSWLVTLYDVIVKLAHAVAAIIEAANPL